LVRCRLANKLWLKVADVAALEEDYYKAIDNYEKVARASINNNLMRYSVKEYFLKAGICHLATGDIVAVQRALAKYQELDPGFAAQREFALLTDLTAAVEKGKQDEFTDKLFQYDQISKLDKWKTTILLKVKNSIQGGSGAVGGAAGPGAPDDDDEFA
jgi:alpha-soluble NSF attachment protein